MTSLHHFLPGLPPFFFPFHSPSAPFLRSLSRRGRFFSLYISFVSAELRCRLHLLIAHSVTSV
jgi:hypothetical protein